MPKCPVDPNDYELHKQVTEGFLSRFWQKAIGDSLPDRVLKLMRQNHIDPNCATSDLGKSPLTQTLLAIPFPGQEEEQAQTLHILMRAGAELRMYDANKMYPADYAMLSANPDAAELVVMETMRQFAGTGRTPYTPDVTGFFLTTLAEEGKAHDRLFRLDCYTDNYFRIQPVIQELAERKTPGFDTPEIRAFWKDYPDLTYENLPKVSEAASRTVSELDQSAEGRHLRNFAIKQEILSFRR